jgi:hypothetical protein
MNMRTQQMLTIDMSSVVNHMNGLERARPSQKPKVGALFLGWLGA